MRGLDTPPIIRVIVPSLNQAQYLETAILSVISQDHPAKACIVVDGGPVDGSVEIIEKYQHQLAHWTSERDDGQADAIRKGFARSIGGVLTWLNSDDVLMPGALTFVAEILKAHSQIAWLTGRTATMDRRGRLVEIGPTLGRFRGLARRVLDATVGGKLEVFPRVDYYELF